MEQRERQPGFSETHFPETPSPAAPRDAGGGRSWPGMGLEQPGSPQQTWSKQGHLTRRKEVGKQAQRRKDTFLGPPSSHAAEPSTKPSCHLFRPSGPYLCPHPRCHMGAQVTPLWPHHGPGSALGSSGAQRGPQHVAAGRSHTPSAESCRGGCWCVCSLSSGSVPAGTWWNCHRAGIGRAGRPPPCQSSAPAQDVPVALTVTKGTSPTSLQGS